MNEKEKCQSCNGTGQQVFHTAFSSNMGKCNFCWGHGTRQEEEKWFDKNFKERGLT